MQRLFLSAEPGGAWVLARGLFPVLLFLAACAGGGKIGGDAAPGGGPAPPMETSRFFAGPLDEARLLIASGAEDPCAVCAETSRRKAFRILDRRLAPGVLIVAAPDCRIVPVPSGGPELELDCPRAGGEPGVTFRFHVSGDRLVGIADADLTDDATAAAVREGRAVETIRVLAYPYGDGATYLYSPSTNRVQVQCRIESIAAE